MEERRYLLVESTVVPQVFLRVLHAKELLASGEAKNVSRATHMAGISRSAFYKYKDSIFHASVGSEVITLNAKLLDETGALQELLTALSQAGAGVATINQSMPENGAADVSIAVRTEGMKGSLDELLRQLKNQRTLVEIRQKK